MCWLDGLLHGLEPRDFAYLEGPGERGDRSYAGKLS
jgi:hypothetical protein